MIMIKKLIEIDPQPGVFDLLQMILGIRVRNR